ncbi:hypothetical protein HYDPIDRAFT_27974 [Hydnomerulius pinastri MD-312]|uniref:Uncharacterized protein n=1 Tax=Hydnomerulius pinastri MD-312 TaxID=994086 RepID=A0A0C9W2K2_9AGAM|nr:hypothetical protein HYDPIDRAFT_27974 [Hydnomerulius pinastri MD-312]
MTESRASNGVKTMTHSLHTCETLHQSSPSPGRPLSYTEMVQHWCKALAKREAIRRSFEEAQQEFCDHASDIIEVIGPTTHTHFHDMYVAALAPNARHDRLASCDRDVRATQHHMVSLGFHSRRLSFMGEVLGHLVNPEVRLMKTSAILLLVGVAEVE